MLLNEEFVSASLVICERVLVEADGVASAIRLVDIIYVPKQQVETPEGIRIILPIFALLSVRIAPRPTSDRTITVKITSPDNKTQTLFGPNPVALAGNPLVSGTDAPRGTNFVIQLNFEAVKYGTHIMRAFLDDKEIAMAPFTLQQSPEQKPGNQS